MGRNRKENEKKKSPKSAGRVGIKQVKCSG